MDATRYLRGKMLNLTSDQLRGNLLLKQYLLEVDLRHISLFNDELAHAIQDKPSEILPLVCFFLLDFSLFF